MRWHISTAGLFEEHDRSRFEITGDLAWRPKSRESEIRRAPEWAPSNASSTSRAQGDLRVAEMINSARNRHRGRSQRFHRRHCVPHILARRPAPVQVSLPRLSRHDGRKLHRLHNRRHDGAAARWILANFSEKPVWLPDSYQVCDTRRAVSANARQAVANAACRKPAFVFCCFNAAYKITPETCPSLGCGFFSAVAGGVLWLAKPQGRWQWQICARQRLRAASRQSGWCLRRVCRRWPIIWRATVNADLFLDTLPYNAHTTAADALWAGLPVLTCRGATFAGRSGRKLTQRPRLARTYHGFAGGL